MLGELGISLNLTELIKIVKFVPINKQNHLNYQFVVDKLYETEPVAKEKLTEAEFRTVMKKVLAEGGGGFNIPISVSKLTSLLQAKHFKKYEEKELLPLVRSIDVNEDEQVDSEDLKRFNELIGEKTFKDMSTVDI